MVITALEECKKNKNRINIYMDGNFVFACYKEIAVEFGIGTGKELSSQQIEEIERYDGEQYAFQTALQYVAARQRTQKDIVGKLRGKGLNETYIEAAMQKMQEYGYVDDTEYARLYAEELCAKYGKKMVYHKLLQKGIDSETASEVTAQQDDSETLRLFTERLRERYAGEAEPKRKQKMIRALLQKGFEYDDIKGMIEHGCEE